MRLGDLQRSAIDVLNVVKQSSAFQQLATIQGVSGITVGSYTGQFTLPSVVADSKSVIKVPAGPAPSITLTADSAVPASGWYKGDVTFTATAADEQGTNLSYEIDNDGTVVDYTGPVVISGDGVHTISLFGTATNDLPAVKTMTVKIDGTAPVASVVSSTGGKLSLEATDEGSGVASIQYSVNGGSTWSTYTAAVTIAGAPKAVEYRAIDKAGNVSAVKSVTVQGVLSLGKPVIKGTAQVGSKLTASATVTSGATLTYQWLRNGKAIAGATKSTYTPVAADAVTKLTVTVTAKKAQLRECLGHVGPGHRGREAGSGGPGRHGYGDRRSHGHGVGGLAHRWGDVVLPVVA